MLQTDSIVANARALKALCLALLRPQEGIKALIPMCAGLWRDHPGSALSLPHVRKGLVPGLHRPRGTARHHHPVPKTPQPYQVPKMRPSERAHPLCCYVNQHDHGSGSRT
ncbi:unnamed protein product, partial [Ectocarpus sp. 13 AM-2016]